MEYSGGANQLLGGHMCAEDRDHKKPKEQTCVRKTPLSHHLWAGLGLSLSSLLLIQIF